MGTKFHTFFVKLTYSFFPYFSNSLEIVNPVTNNDDIKAIIIVCSNVMPMSNNVSATFPDTKGEKKDTPKLPPTLAIALIINIL